MPALSVRRVLKDGSNAGCKGIQGVDVKGTGFVKKDEGNETMREEPESSRAERKNPCKAYYPRIPIPTEPLLRCTVYSLERDGNSVAPYFPLTSDLYVLHLVLPRQE